MMASWVQILLYCRGLLGISVVPQTVTPALCFLEITCAKQAGLQGDKTAFLIVLGAINTVYPEADHQRCWVHKMCNMFVYFPKRLHVKVKRLLRQMYDATTREQAETLMAQFAEVYGRDYPRAVECLLKDRDDLLTYYRYPQEHWVSLKTTKFS